MNKLTTSLLLVTLGVCAAPSSAERPPGQGFQGYLDEAPYGIDARYAWGIPGGNGRNVTIFDAEQSWGIGTDPEGKPSYRYPGPPTHDDLSSAHDAPLLFPPGDDCQPFDNTGAGEYLANHGTRVLGELIANNDGIGVTGISWGAAIALVPTCPKPPDYPNFGDVVQRATEVAEPGDVILLEAQMNVCNNLPYGARIGPVEWQPAAFAAIQRAVGAGIVVVAAAGNNPTDLDQPACNGRFDRDQQDSGAIIVGAGQPPDSTRMATPWGPLLSTDGARDAVSAYGSRVDLQGWGSQVNTTRDPQGLTVFSGTSSAAPMVAGAAANLQSIAIEHWGWSLEPLYVRELLVKTGAYPAGYDDSEHIGPRPDLRGAIDKLFRDIPLCGDLDGDLHRTKLDVASAQSCASRPSSYCTQLCDVDGDKACTNTDAALILEVVKGASPKTLVCESPHLFGQDRSGGRGSLQLP